MKAVKLSNLKVGDLFIHKGTLNMKSNKDGL
jgi:hypothetical protein